MKRTLFNEIVEETTGGMKRKDFVLFENHTMELVFLKGHTAILHEGLIKTYPIDRIIGFLARVYNFSKNQTDIKNILRGESTKQGVIFRNDGYEKNEGDVLTIITESGQRCLFDKYLNKYGWFLACEFKYGAWENVSVYQYEQKFGVDVTDIVKSKTLYHICNKKHLSKILKKGLVPKESKSGEFKHPGRIYLFIKKLTDKTVYDRSKELKRVKDNSESEFVLLSINTNRIANNPKFYYDPRVDDGSAVYTMDNIGPEAITVEKIIQI